MPTIGSLSPDIMQQVYASLNGRNLAVSRAVSRDWITTLNDPSPAKDPRNVKMDRARVQAALKKGFEVLSSSRYRYGLLVRLQETIIHFRKIVGDEIEAWITEPYGHAIPVQEAMEIINDRPIWQIEFIVLYSTTGPDQVLFLRPPFAHPVLN